MLFTVISHLSCEYYFSSTVTFLCIFFSVFYFMPYHHPSLCSTMLDSASSLTGYTMLLLFSLKFKYFLPCLKTEKLKMNRLKTSKSPHFK